MPILTGSRPRRGPGRHTVRSATHTVRQSRHPRALRHGRRAQRQSIPKLQAKLIVGAANNQLAEAVDAQRLAELGVVYVPDYVANAGGIINAFAEFRGEASADVDEIARSPARHRHRAKQLRQNLAQHRRHHDRDCRSPETPLQPPRLFDLSPLRPTGPSARRHANHQSGAGRPRRAGGPRHLFGAHAQSPHARRRPPHPQAAGLPPRLDRRQNPPHRRIHARRRTRPAVPPRHPGSRHRLRGKSPAPGRSHRRRAASRAGDHAGHGDQGKSGK